jgi:hypothetical protein
MSKFSDSTFYLAPSGYRETILFPQKPLSSIGQLSVTRASSATRTNPAGQVEEVCYNLIRYSEDFSNSLWVKIAASVTTDSIISPNGTLTSDKLIATAVNTGHLIYQTYSAQTQTYTFSTYAKKGEYDYMIMRLDNDISTVRVWFNLSNGTIGTSQGGFPTITNIGNGWYRCTMTYSSASVQNIFAVLYTANADNVQNFLGDGTSGIFVWGAQLVQGNLPKDYLYTSDRLNFPRVDYSDGSASFLLEPQRTNLLLQSNTFNTTWAMFAGPAVNANSAISPDGTNNAWTLNSSGGGNDFLFQNITVNIGTTYTTTLYIKNINSNQSRIWTSDGAGLTVDLYWNGSILTSILGTSGTYSFTSVGNGWYRIVGVFTSTQSTYIFRIYSDALNTSKSVYIYGAQVETGAYPTTYIPTTTTTVTRLADTFTRNNIFTNNLISSSGGTWFVDLKANLSVFRDAFSNGLQLADNNTSGGISGNGFIMRRNDLSQGRLNIQKVIAGNPTALFQTTTDTVKAVIKWNGTTADVFINGIKQVSATSFTTTNMEFLLGYATDVPKYITQMALWNTPLSDSQCIELTGVAYTTPTQAYGSLNLVSESPDCLYTSVNTINRI